MTKPIVTLQIENNTKTHKKNNNYEIKKLYAFFILHFYFFIIVYSPKERIPINFTTYLNLIQSSL